MSLFSLPSSEEVGGRVLRTVAGMVGAVSEEFLVFQPLQGGTWGRGCWLPPRWDGAPALWGNHWDSHELAEKSRATTHPFKWCS